MNDLIRTMLIVTALTLAGATAARAQAPPAPEPVVAEPTPMDMAPYFSVISYPVPKDTLMVKALSDFQAARTTRDFVTGMVMVEYGILPRWTAGAMVEGQTIFGQPTTYGGFRVNTYVRVLPHDRLLNLTLYAEYEGLDGAALYKMEVAGFGGEDLTEPLATARRTAVRTLEERAIVYHDWGRLGLAVNLVSETSLDGDGNDFGYAWGVFRQPAYRGMAPTGEMAGMTGMPAAAAPPLVSLRRLGYGVEMMGALGDADQFGLYWQREQHYVGPIVSYTVARAWTLHLQATFGLSDVSDPFMLRVGIGYALDHLLRR